MISFKTEKKVLFTSKQIFDLIMDIEKYPEFLPWIKHVNIIEKKENNVVAELIIYFKGYKTSYISNVTTKIQDKDYKIFIESNNGPFKILKNVYSIYYRDDSSCLIEFNNMFEFRLKILEGFIGHMLTDRINRIISVFEDRAKKIYKKQNL